MFVIYLLFVLCACSCILAVPSVPRLLCDLSVGYFLFWCVCGGGGGVQGTCVESC